jgi:hypothetical protein
LIHTAERNEIIMIITNTSPRFALFMTALAGIIVACSADAPSADPITGGAGGSGGGGTSAAGSSAAGMAQAGSSVAGTTAGSTTTAGSGGVGGAAVGGVSGAGVGGAGGAGGGSAGKGGSGGMPVQNGPVCDITAEGTGAGKISYERWLGVTGIEVSQIPTGTPPSTTLELTQLKQTSAALDTFGARIRGYLTAPLSGMYRFWINCDDNCELDLSTTELPANKVKLAWVEGPDGWTSESEWSKSTTQRSAPVMLEKDKRYYVEVLHKEGIGGDHVGVGWQLPGESGFVPCEVVPGAVLSPYEADGPSGAGGEGGEGGGAQ